MKAVEARIIALQIQAQAIQVEVTGMEMSDLYAVHNDVSGGKYVDAEYTKRAAALLDLADEVLRLSNEL